MLIFHKVAGLCPSCSITDLALCLWPGRLVEDSPSVWAPTLTWSSQMKLKITGFSKPSSSHSSPLGRNPTEGRALFSSRSLSVICLANTLFKKLKNSIYKLCLGRPALITVVSFYLYIRILKPHYFYFLLIIGKLGTKLKHNHQ